MSAIRVTRERARAAGACWSDDAIASIIPTEGLSPRELDDRIGQPGYAKTLGTSACVWALVCASGAPRELIARFAGW